MDHWLGPDARIRHGGEHSVVGMVESLHRIAEHLPYQDAAVAGLRSLDGTKDRRKHGGAADGTKRRFFTRAGLAGISRQSERDCQFAISGIVAARARIIGRAPLVWNGNRI